MLPPDGPTTCIKTDGRTLLHLWEMQPRPGPQVLGNDGLYRLLFVSDGALALRHAERDYALAGGSFLSLSPYHLGYRADAREATGFAIDFHPDFFCVYKHDRELNAEQVLFNDFVETPFCRVGEVAGFRALFDVMRGEVARQEPGYHEVIVGLLKSILIQAARHKRQAISEGAYQRQSAFPETVTALVNLVEANFRSLHRPGDYAARLHCTPATLNRLSRQYLGCSTSHLLARRIVLEAKRELYLSSAPVREVAAALGYADEFYFSRFFKRHVGVSPVVYRKTVGAGRAALLRG